MNTTIKLLPLAIISVLLTACGSSSTGTGSAGTATISGTVPGTKIEAFGDNGSYYVTNSTVPTPDNGKHPFSLTVPAGVGMHLVMTMNDGSPGNEVVQPIGFKDKNGNVQTRLVLGKDDATDMGDVPLYADKTAAGAASSTEGSDVDGDGILDTPFVLDTKAGAKNPLKTTDADKDGVKDFDDTNGNGQELASGAVDSQDRDSDGIPNSYDATPGTALAASIKDTDKDGLPDSIDANPDNSKDGNLALANSTDGYLDSDKNHDGFPDGDKDHNGLDESAGDKPDDVSATAK